MKISSTMTAHVESNEGPRKSYFERALEAVEPKDSEATWERGLRVLLLWQKARSACIEQQMASLGIPWEPMSGMGNKIGDMHRVGTLLGESKNTGLQNVVLEGASWWFTPNDYMTCKVLGLVNYRGSEGALGAYQWYLTLGSKRAEAIEEDRHYEVSSAKTFMKLDSEFVAARFIKGDLLPAALGKCGLTKELDSLIVHAKGERVEFLHQKHLWCMRLGSAQIMLQGYNDDIFLCGTDRDVELEEIKSGKQGEMVRKFVIDKMDMSQEESDAEEEVKKTEEAYCVRIESGVTDFPKVLTLPIKMGRKALHFNGTDYSAELLGQLMLGFDRKNLAYLLGVGHEKQVAVYEHELLNYTVKSNPENLIVKSLVPRI